MLNDYELKASENNLKNYSGFIESSDRMRENWVELKQKTDQNTK